ncbi:MAG: WD40/YVTN/BNR-like repeat-containing protein, partial [Marinicella sp.]
GVTDVVMDPRDPNRLYAATWQRHRTVAAYMGGGPNTAIYKSEDGGNTWDKLSSGLPDGSMGKIGLAISPQKPDEVYAAIELERRTGGIYKSFNRGATWNKQSDAVAGGTGPHYYQELYASPHQYDRLYLMSNNMIISDDGGETYRTMNEKNKHVDNHAIVFKPSDPDYVLIGTDGGLYESFDLTQSWKFVANLPVTQFYKVAVDDAEPFYHIYGGTQDNNTQGGPSRTDNIQGIRNSDWYVVLFGDGHQPATEPGNPDIVYAEWQQGNLVRVDKTTGEMVYIQPQPDAGEAAERFNWDAPILVSPHNPTTLYFASQRVWRSDDRGDSWRAISGDLTKNQERIELPIMGSKQGWDMPWDLLAMSNYNTITSISESPVEAGLIYIGTDDGLIQITENGGESWNKVAVGKLPNVPATAFVNDIKADLHDSDTVYIALDNHKYGDFNPYLLKSKNRGKSWQKMNTGIPDNHLVWRVVQDHVDPDLMFAGTEFGLYFSLNGGGKWFQMTGGLPTISIRDLAIQKRENDLVAASFGRGFYVLDDYSMLRGMDSKTLEQDQVFPVKDALWYLPRIVLGFNEKASQGDAFYNAKNPPFGAVFNYHLKEGLATKKAMRQKAEGKATDDKKSLSFPGWDEVDAERTEREPKIWLTVKNDQGEIVRRVKGTTEKGFNQVAWNLRSPGFGVVGEGGGFFSDEPQGMLVAPGKYVVSLTQEVNGEISQLGEPQSFAVKPLRKGALKGADHDVVVGFWQELTNLSQEVSITNKKLSEALERTKLFEQALEHSLAEHGEADIMLHKIISDLHAVDKSLNGNRSKQEVGEKTGVTVGSRLGAAFIGTGLSTYGPTPTHRKSLDLAQQEFSSIQQEVNRITGKSIPEFEKILTELGAPYVH